MSRASALFHGQLSLCGPIAKRHGLPSNYFDDSYIYDANGNISSISRLQNGQTQNLSYEYDGLDQLVRVNDQKASTTTLYTYDAGGNITSAKTYPYTTGAVSGAPLSQNTYTYSSSGWKDLLTNFNGDSILYDEIGNPIQYRDGMTFSWESGRQLSSITQGDSAYSYSYDASGTRISKTVNGSTYSYIYDNGQLIYADTPSGGMTFIYENDSVIGYTYNSAYYYYLKNLQGISWAVDKASGNLLYQYEYDAWGNPTVLDAQGSVISPSASHVANSNPSATEATSSIQRRASITSSAVTMTPLHVGLLMRIQAIFLLFQIIIYCNTIYLLIAIIIQLMIWILEGSYPG